MRLRGVFSGISWLLPVRVPLSDMDPGVWKFTSATGSGTLPPWCETRRPLVDTKWTTDGKRRLRPRPGRARAEFAGREPSECADLFLGPLSSTAARQVHPSSDNPDHSLSSCSIKGSDVVSGGSLSSGNC